MSAPQEFNSILHRPVCTMLAGTTEAWFWRDVKDIDFEGRLWKPSRVSARYLLNEPVSRPGIPQLSSSPSRKLRRLKEIPAQEALL